MLQRIDRMRHRLTLAVFFTCLLGVGAASANGRFPSAQLVLGDPLDPKRLWLRATYGLLTSADGGCTWHYICEGAPGYSGTTDPMFGVMADGTLIGAIPFHGVAASRDRGCSWSGEPALEGQFVVDLAVQPSDPTRAIAIASTGRADGGYTNQIWRTTDSALRWTRLGLDLDPSLLPLTLDAAPSAPNRIYVTAIRATAAEGGTALTESVLLRTDDDGASWRLRPIPGSSDGFDAWLSAIHPSDPDKLYVRLRGPDSAPQAVENRVVYSADGGETWQQIFEARADILGFVLAPDGSRVLLGLGDSRDVDRARPVDLDVLGIYSARTTDHRFARTRSGQIGCLAWLADGLYFCAAQFPPGGGPGFELGLSTDDGASSKMVMHLASIEGMLECSAGTTTAQVCEQSEWTQICTDLGRCDFETGSYLPYPRGETCPEGTGGTGGAGGGASGRAGSSGPPDAGPAGNPAGASVTASGGCSAAGRASGVVAVLLALFAAGARLRVRRQ